MAEEGPKDCEVRQLLPCGAFRGAFAIPRLEETREACLDRLAGTPSSQAGSALLGPQPS